ncbi:MAG: Gfo/Idh/MocA family oxidoreductase [Rhodobacteraceae bacterium]|nr:Gfo/Idh/MocA family oxidoreductase [Paracoccaceae bacterium]
MTAAPPFAATGIGLVGGGRWAGVIATVLRQIVPPDVPVWAVSPSDPSAWADINGQPGWHRAGHLDDILRAASISHVIIARRARDHAATALACLDARKAVLIEKPFCLTQPDAERLERAAQGQICATGHVFAYASNIMRFRQACLDRGPVRTVTLLWGDSAQEIRHGAAKRFDAGLNVFQDVLPHAWSILRPFLPEATELKLAHARIKGGGRCVLAHFQGGETCLRVALSRQHRARMRRVMVTGDGWQAMLDFSVEPGRAMIAGQPLDVAEGFSSPLRAQLLAFLTNTPLPETDLQAAGEAIAVTSAGLRDIRQQQARLLARGLGTPSADYALQEIAQGGIDGDGRTATAVQIAQWAGLPLAHVQRALADLSNP